jgi:hypothetical protein
VTSGLPTIHGSTSIRCSNELRMACSDGATSEAAPWFRLRRSDRHLAYLDASLRARSAHSKNGFVPCAHAPTRHP